MRCIIFFICCIAITCTDLFSQKIEVYEKNEIIEKLQRKGMASTTFLERQTLEKGWLRKLKEYGKTEYKGDLITVPIATITELSPTPVKVYSKVTQSQKGTEIWWAIDLGTEFITRSHEKYKQAARILHDYIFTAHVEDIENQTQEAEKVLNQSTWDYERRMKEEQRIKKQMDNNRQAKAQLLERLSQNKQDSLQLVADLHQNKLNQTADSLEVVKMRKALEIVKAKVTKLE